jgi:hypothetical protein
MPNRVNRELVPVERFNLIASVSTVEERLVVLLPVRFSLRLLESVDGV